MRSQLTKYSHLRFIVAFVIVIVMSGVAHATTYYESNVIWANRPDGQPPDVLGTDPVETCREAISRSGYVPHYADPVVAYYTAPVAGGYTSRYYFCSGQWIRSSDGQLLSNGVTWMYATCPPYTSPLGTGGYGICDHQPQKNIGTCNGVGNPILCGSGVKAQRETDLPKTSISDLSFERLYFSDPAMGTGRMGKYWRDQYDHSVGIAQITPGGHFLLNRGTERAYGFQWANNTLTADPDTIGTLSRLTDGSGQLTGWSYATASNDTELFDASGRLLSITSKAGVVQTLSYAGSQLISVTDSFGRTLSFTYNANNRIDTITDPAGGVFHYSYDANNNLTSVTYPDNLVRTYVYGELVNTSNSNLPNALTGIVDESGVRYATYQYDTTGRPYSTEHAGGVDKTSIAYTSWTGGPPTVTDPLGTARTYYFEKVQGAIKSDGVTQFCTGENCAKSITYDANGNVASRVDFNNIQSQFNFDLTRNLELSRTEALGTPTARTITTQWHPTYRLPTLITEPGRSTAYGYDGSGNLLTRTVTDTATNGVRTWTYTYNNFGQVLTVDGPRTDVNDVTTYTYYTCNTGGACGQLHTVTNALGQTTTYATYNATGQPLTIEDANGVTTTLAYDARQRLTSRSVAGEVTSFEYWPTGLLKKVTLPDASSVTYAYDNAHRLTGITDSEDNYIVYTLDAAGNRTQEQAFDATNNLARTRSRVFNTLSRLTQELGAANQSTTYSYDNNGNLTSVTDPVNHATQYQYDPLNRLALLIDPALQNTAYGYDAQDNLTSVTDPKTLTTSYAYNGLGDLTQLTSPDTGVTQYAHDAAGNLDLATDARNEAGDYSYDALGRVTQIQYSDQTQSFQYDQGANGKGHLTQVTDASGNTTYSYNALGRTQSKTQTIGSQSKTVQYAYTNGQLTSITTPSGQTIGYSYTHGKPTGISVNGQSLLSNVLYSPFGPTRGWTWGNNTLTVREYDQDGQLTTLDSAGLSTYTYHPDGTIASISHDSSANLGLPTGTTNLTVSATSNRIESTTGTLTRTYSYDNAGNTTSDGSRTFTYNAAGRLATATNMGTTTGYQYNALGQRVFKSNSNETIHFVYDESGHLLGEYDQSGALIQELVYLGDIPVATIRTDQGGSGVGVFYIHTDHLNAPTKVTRSTNNEVIWRWDHDPFGNGTPNEDPDGNGLTLAMNLRFPGQYADQETGLNYNYFRDYDPATGRYFQSDPIGLEGGINTYGYVGGNPISRRDPFGLFFSHVHMEVTAEALVGSGLEGTCMNQALMSAILWDFEPGSQDPPMAYTHSMSVPGESAAAAAAKSNQDIRDQITKCDCVALGRALHTAQDSAAGGHQYKEYTGLLNFGMISHYFEDMYPSNDRVTEALVKSKNVLNEFKSQCKSCSK